MATIDITSAPVDPDVGDLYEHYRTMFLIRRFEEAAERQYKAARIGGYCHLSSGQEAATVGAVAAMQPEDLLVTGYRCHGFALARGVPAEAVMAELFGRAHGCAHGRGGSMHLLDVSRGYYGGRGIVGGPMPRAHRVGSPAAARLKQAGEERGPAVLEAVTYRYRGHSVADAGLAYRSKEEIEEHRREDPLSHTRELLEARGVPSEGFAAMEAEVEAEVEAAVAFAEHDAPPAVDGLAAGVYAPGSEEQFERMRPGSPFGEAELV